MSPSNAQTTSAVVHPLPGAVLESAKDASRVFESALRSVPLYALLAATVHPSLAHRACWLCGCLPPGPPLGAAQKDEYLDCVAAEIAILADRLNGRGRLASVAFGAGAPTPLSADEIAAVLDMIEDALGLTDLTSIAVEMTPEMVCLADMRGLVALGVTRFTVFAESAAPGGVAFNVIEDAVGALRDAAADDVGLAYIADLPARSSAEAVDQAERLLALGPDRLVLHRLADRISRDPAFVGIAPPLHRAAPFPAADRFRAAGFVEAPQGVFVKAEQKLDRAASLDARLAGAQIGLGAGGLGRLGTRLFRNVRRLDVYAGVLDLGLSPVELAAPAPSAF